MADIFDPRERRANQLLMRGRATVDELLEASYGEWPVQGLDVIGTNNQSVNLRPLIEPVLSRDELNDLLDIHGNATLHGERTIRINPLLYPPLRSLIKTSSLFNSVLNRSGANFNAIGTLQNSSPNELLGHEAVHILQGDHYSRAGDFFGKPQNNINYVNQAAYDLFNNFTRVGLPKRTSYQIYLQEGQEIQARIHELLAQGYSQWGRLPQNQEELWTALSDTGLTLPRAIKEQLEKSPTIQKTREIFFSNKLNIYSMPKRQLEDALSALTYKGQEVFWEKTLPGMYSDLIEMYGDKLGRERFGLGVNERAVLRSSPEYLNATIERNLVEASRFSNLSTIGKVGKVLGGAIAVVGTGAAVLHVKSAMDEHRGVEAAMRAFEDGAGLLGLSAGPEGSIMAAGAAKALTEVVRPVAGLLGADVDRSIGETNIAKLQTEYSVHQLREGLLNKDSPIYVAVARDYGTQYESLRASILQASGQLSPNFPTKDNFITARIKSKLDDISDYGIGSEDQVPSGVRRLDIPPLPSVKACTPEEPHHGLENVVATRPQELNRGKY